MRRARAGRRGRRVLGWLALVAAVTAAAGCGVPRRLSSMEPDPRAVPVEQWPAVTEQFLQAMAEGDHSRAYDHTCRPPELRPPTREEFVAHHRDSLRPVHWVLHRAAGGSRTSGGTSLYGMVTFADGREAKVWFTVYERGVCRATSTDRWANPILDPSPRRPAR